jgi:hypothetical protein
MRDSLPEPWKSFFSDIDQALSQEVELHCLGGFVAKVLYDLERETADVDILPVATNSEIDAALRLGLEGSKLHKKHGVYLQIVGLAPIPYDYESRLTEIYPGSFKHTHLFALDPYDLALSKIERNSLRDRDDVIHLARRVPFDLDTLRDRFETEMRPDLGNPDREARTLQQWIELIEEDRLGAKAK